MPMEMAAASCVIFMYTLLLQIIASDGKVSSVIVFGDSSVDSGNNNFLPTLLKSNFKPYGRDFSGGVPTGRFSNGRIPTDFISEAFGLKKTVPPYLDTSYTIQDFATGVCFASAGTGYDNATSKVLSVMPLWKEVEYYKEYQNRLRNHFGKAKANEILREALYIISIGTNDFLENYYLLSHRRLQFTVKEYEEFLLGIAEEFVREIYELGARKVCLTALPPMGCLPLERTMNLGKCNDGYNDVAMDFNRMLEGLVRNLNQQLVGMKMVLSSPYDILYDIIQNPQSYAGFEHSAKACCGTGRFEMSYLCNSHNPFTCSDATKYVFWDSFHPTDKTNAIVAHYVFTHFLQVFQ